MHGICMVYAWHMHGVCILSTRSRRASSASTQTPSLTLALLLAPTLTANQALTSIKARAPRPIPRRPRWPRRERRRRNCSPSRYRTDHEVPRCPTCRRIPRSSSTRYAASRMSCVRGFKLLATHHAPRTTHHALLQVRCGFARGFELLRPEGCSESDAWEAACEAFPDSVLEEVRVT